MECHQKMYALFLSKNDFKWRRYSSESSVDLKIDIFDKQIELSVCRIHISIEPRLLRLNKYFIEILRITQQKEVTQTMMMMIQHVVIHWLHAEEQVCFDFIGFGTDCYFDSLFLFSLIFPSNKYHHLSCVVAFLFFGSCFSGCHS